MLLARKELNLAKMILNCVLPIVMEIQNVLMVLMNLIVVSLMMNCHGQEINYPFSLKSSPSATDAPATSLPSATIAAVLSTESTGNEKDRANAPQTTTDTAEATLPQVSILDRETLSPGVVTTDERIYQIARIVCLLKTIFICLLCLLRNFTFFTFFFRTS
jgi:hypothetical protein